MNRAEMDVQLRNLWAALPGDQRQTEADVRAFNVTVCANHTSLVQGLRTSTLKHLKMVLTGLFDDTTCGCMLSNNESGCVDF